MQRQASNCAAVESDPRLCCNRFATLVDKKRHKVHIIVRLGIARTHG